ncbi:signal peptide-domain containing protein [Rhodopirellula sallentina SM41]|uniref:Signal peptide-domain containing protein n=2 Tax=Rhodopirellula TaxID=265488 RepID=M5UB67_9BACT|nr:signal peptide-domain containing protein [Rhodopirellula sallentina SM41]
MNVSSCRRAGLLGLLVALNITSLAKADGWIVDDQTQWTSDTLANPEVELEGGLATPKVSSATIQSKLKTFAEKRSASSMVVSQTTAWQNWEPTDIGPQATRDAPVLLRMGPKDYWFFAKFGRPKSGKNGSEKFTATDAQLKGFDIPLKTTQYPNQYDAPGGLKKSAGGYHAWQSHDMIHWVHHGCVTSGKAGWVTTAEVVDGKVYLFYDFPNDQDPHLVIDDDLFDGVPGTSMGMVFSDPSDGSDVAIIRDLNGTFHCIYEDWSPIDPSTHSWDSPLAGHAVSPDGITPFEIVGIAVDERTEPTGKFAEYFHPHWYAAAPNKFPGKPVPQDIKQHRIKKGDIRSFSKYEIHEPEQNAYGDWAAIAIGGQYYLFCDVDPATSHQRDGMSVGWFTSTDINEPFQFCDHIGKGHPDPDIMFAEGRFYLATQTNEDYVSPGPWVDGVEARVGVDTDNDTLINQWTSWQTLKESYEAVPGFAKQVAKTPARMDLSDLPAGYGFQFEIRLNDTTENDSKPNLDRVEMEF